MKTKRYNILTAFLSLPLLFSCQSTNVTFSVKGKATIEILDPSNLTGKGEDLGPSPAIISKDRLEGKVVKISRGGDQAMYWYFVSGDSSSNEISIDSEDATIFGNEKDQLNDNQANFTHRTLLRAYRALVSSNFELAIELAKTISQADPKIAAPYIVEGLALAESGKKNEARVILKKAFELDPSDSDLGRLIQSIE